MKTKRSSFVVQGKQAGIASGSRLSAPFTSGPQAVAGCGPNPKTHALRRLCLCFGSLCVGLWCGGCSEANDTGQDSVGESSSGGSSNSRGGAPTTGGNTGSNRGGSTTEAGGNGSGASSTTPTGGATASGGSATGGVRTSGGTTGSGGMASSGGTVATGGTTVSGGMPATGGTTSAGGSQALGGTTSGGSGGNPSSGGKATSGGSSSGGALPTGGTRSTGGTATGGVATGGSASGGVATGGKATGGVATGGTASGGVATGGVGTGGTATGGTTTTSSCPNTQRTITVAKDGSGQFTSVNSAVASIASGNTTRIEIAIKPGTYNEKVAVNKPYVCLSGENPDTTKITYGDNANAGGDLNTMPSVNITATDVSAVNLSFENSTALGGSQAIAVRTTVERIQFRNCKFLSYQDTLYTWGGTAYFRDCTIQGTVDYIFGPAAAVFQDCTMYNASGGSAITAPSTPQGQTYGFVFLGGKLTAASSVKASSVALARPWRPYARAAYLNVDMGAHVLAAGWTTMSSNDLSLTTFCEYNSTGAGANPTGRASPSKQLTAAEAAQYTVSNVLGGWTPTFSQ